MPARGSNGAAKAAAKVARRRAVQEEPEAARAPAWKGRLAAATAAVAVSIALVAAVASSPAIGHQERQEPYSSSQEGPAQPTCSADGTCNVSSSLSAAPATPKGEVTAVLAEENTPEKLKTQDHVEAATVKTSSKLERRKEGWWKKGVTFQSPHVFHLHTLNFNETITQNKQVLVAYYDSRSQSFKELQPELDAAAELLARRAAEGNPLGMLAACDASVNTYLRAREAPTMQTGWQEIGGGSSFKFGRPRFLPIIMMFYSNGTRRGEYANVISPAAIAAFMHRHAAPLGGHAVEGPAAARKLLKEPGPLVFGCELEPGSKDLEAFTHSAHTLHGSVVPVFAPAVVCSEVLKAKPPWPRVIWAAGAASSGQVSSGGRKKGITRMLTNGTVRADTALLSSWLLEQKAEIMEEMTPDNSYLYLEQPEALVIFLVDPSDSAAMERGNHLFSQINKELQAVEKFRLVWSDCRAFGDQFAAANECPVVVIVRPANLDWRKVTVAELDRAASGPKGPDTAAGHLLHFLVEVTKPWRDMRLEQEREAKQREEEAKAGNAANGTKQAATSEEQDGDTSADGNRIVFSRDSYLNSVLAMIMDPHGQNGADPYRGYENYMNLLSHLLLLRRSYRAVYDGQLPFDFSDVYRVQNLHKHMSALGRTPGEVRAKVTDPKKKKALYRAIEERAAFTDLLKKNDSSAATDAFTKALNRGYRVLRTKFVALMAHLHKHAAAGTLGVPEARPLEVERRSADELSVQEFVEKYARPGKPVIITGLNLTGDQPEWTLDFFRDRCNVSAEYRKKNPNLDSWGRLQFAGRLPLAEFIDTFKTNATRRQWYLHDWGLPPHCPDAFGPPPYRGFTVPKYFAGDYFQRAGFEGYQHSWPSLFIGSSGTESAMHVDSGGTNFWLYLLSGKKEWRFFAARDIVNLYLHPLGSSFFVDAFNPDTEEFPLYKYAQMHVGVQEPGELMFIPGGNPHAVRNIEDIHGVSMNYVDASNLWIFLWHMMVEEKWKTVELFTDNVSLPHGLRSDQEAVHFGQWKSTRWWDLSYDIF